MWVVVSVCRSSKSSTCAMAAQRAASGSGAVTLRRGCARAASATATVSARARSASARSSGVARYAWAHSARARATVNGPPGIRYLPLPDLYGQIRGPVNAVFGAMTCVLVHFLDVAEQTSGQRRDFVHNNAMRRAASHRDEAHVGMDVGLV